MPDNTEKGRTLDSWKEVADYLGVTVRTAQKWEAERGLPIRRTPGSRGRIFAYTAELDQWKESAAPAPNGLRNTRSWRRFIVVAGAVFALILLILGVLAWPRIFESREPFSTRTVWIWENGLPTEVFADSVYRFDHAFNLLNYQFGDNFRRRHAELESTGQLDHHFSSAEEDQLKNIRRLR